MMFSKISKGRLSKVLIFSIILATFVTSVMKSPEKAYAQQDAADVFFADYKSAWDPTNFTTIFDVNTTAPTAAGSVATGVTGQATDDAAISGSENIMKEPNFGCFDKTFTTDNIPACLAAGAYYVFFVPTYWLASWMSIFLNFAIFLLVVGMGNLVRNLTGIMTAWAALRDLANIFLVFVTVYVGIATILGISGYGYKKLLWRILLAALLVNFSATFTKGVIDVSNIFALETYKMFITKAGGSMNISCLSDGAPKDNTNKCLTNGLAAVFWTQLKVTSIFDLKELQNKMGGDAKATDLMWNMLMTAIMGGIMFLVMSFVFGGAAFLLVGRFVILVFLIIVSPIALVVWITGISSEGSRWWSTLLNQSMFAPLILLMWWIALQITTGVGAIMGNGSLSVGANAGDVSAVAIVVMFIIIMGFLIMGLVLAKQLGAYGAGAIIKTGDSLARGVAGGLVAYPAGYLATKAAQGYTRKVAASQEVDENGEYKQTGLSASIHRTLAKTPIDRGINKALEAPAKTSFLGTSSYAQRRMEHEKAASERQVDITKQGREAKIKSALDVLNSPYEQKNAQTHGESEKYTQAKQTLAGASTAELEKMHKDHSALSNTDATRNALTQKQAVALSGRADVTPMEKKKLTDTAYKTERTALKGDEMPIEDSQRIVRGMSVAQIEDNSDLIKKHPERLTYLSPEKYEQIVLNKNEKWSSEDLDKFNKARYIKLHTSLENATLGGDRTGLAEAVTKLDNKDLELLSSDVHSNPEFIKSLSQKQYAHLTKTKRSNFSEQQLATFEKERGNYFKQMSSQDAVSEIRKMDPETMVGLDSEFLSRDEVLQEITPRSLSEMVKKGLTKEKQDLMLQKLEPMYRQIKAKKKPIEASTIVNPVTNKPLREAQLTPELTPEEKKIESLYQWFTNDGRPSIN
jgi:hypothetical protein